MARWKVPFMFALGIAVCGITYQSVTLFAGNCFGVDVDDGKCDGGTDYDGHGEVECPLNLCPDEFGEPGWEWQETTVHKQVAGTKGTSNTEVLCAKWIHCQFWLEPDERCDEHNCIPTLNGDCYYYISNPIPEFDYKVKDYYENGSCVEE